MVEVTASFPKLIASDSADIHRHLFICESVIRKMHFRYYILTATSLMEKTGGNSQKTGLPNTCPIKHTQTSSVMYPHITFLAGIAQSYFKATPSPRSLWRIKILSHGRTDYRNKNVSSAFSSLAFYYYDVHFFNAEA